MIHDYNKNKYLFVVIVFKDLRRFQYILVSKYIKSMSLYIHEENQKLIWDSMNKIPQFQQFEGERENWFRSIIEQFYEHNKFKLLSVQELQQLNRDTVLYMIKDLKELQKRDSFQPSHSPFMSFSEPTSISQSSPQVIKFPSGNLEGKAVTRDYMMEQKQEELNKQFSTRQQEYGEMLKYGPTSEVDFRATGGDDKPIENMEELMQQHLKQREYELTQPKAGNSDGLQLDVVNLGGNALSGTSSSVNNSTSLSPNLIYNKITSESTPKNVKWSSNLEQENNKPQLKSVLRGATDKRPAQPTNSDGYVLREFMESMTGYMETMCNEIYALKQGTTKNNSDILSRMKKKPVPREIGFGNLEDISKNFTI
jgi:hypothetical protein